MMDTFLNDSDSNVVDRLVTRAEQDDESEESESDTNTTSETNTASSS